MSFFKIIDVITNSNGNRLGGPSSLGGKQYERNTYRFPEDVGSYDKGHYILFNINEQVNTQFNNPQAVGDVPTIISNIQDLQKRRGITNVSGVFQQGLGVVSQAGSALASRLNSNPNTSGLLGGLNTIAQGGISALTSITGPNNEKIVVDTAGGLKNIATGIKGDTFLRTIRRTKDTIALYMPDSLRFSYGQSYRPLELGSGTLAMAAAFASSGYETVVNKETSSIAPFIANYAAQRSGQPILKALAAAGTGLVTNPMLELIYSSPSFRNFSFSFMLYPRSEKEAQQVQKILETLRFHSAPEIKNNTGGFFLIPPSEFDISFMYNGSANPNIDKISTCVLTNMSVDYAPKGFHAYEVGGENDAKLGRTGMPVGIGLTLSFMETQILTKEYHRNSTFDKIDIQNPGGSAAMGSAMNSAQDGPGNNPNPF
jgi:hypothetical protein